MCLNFSMSELLWVTKFKDLGCRFPCIQKGGAPRWKLASSVLLHMKSDKGGIEDIQTATLSIQIHMCAGRSRKKKLHVEHPLHSGVHIRVLGVHGLWFQGSHCLLRKTNLERETLVKFIGYLLFFIFRKSFMEKIM